MNDNSVDFLSGNESLARGAWEAGLKVACAYPGTPSSEILEYISRFPEVDSQWSVNEKVAFEVAFAAAIGGKRSLYASKHVGMNVAMDAIMTSGYMGVNAGFVIVTCDDPGIHSSQNEQDNRQIARFAKLPLLEPSSPEEAKSFIKEAFEMSENYDTPVILRLTTRISHSKQNVLLENRQEYQNKPFYPDHNKYVMLPKIAYKRHINLENRLMVLKEYSNNSFLNQVEYHDKKLGFITDSVCFLYIKEFFPDASILKLGFPYPFPDQKMIDFAHQVEELFVIEELDPFIEEHVKSLGLPYKGKHPSFLVGELNPDLIRRIVNNEKKPELQLISTRRPSFCPECPYNIVFDILKKFNSIVAGDIGCYTLGALEPFNTIDTVICMGGSITFFEGLQKALNNHTISVIGDSTFFHTGIPALINAVYNGAKGVILILDNSTTAMTGSQPHPGTGLTLSGNETKKIMIEDICKACKVDSVDIINPYDTIEFENLLQKRQNEYNKLSVVIVRFPCIFAKKRMKEIIELKGKNRIGKQNL